jgi:FkbM family methyltransferase
MKAAKEPAGELRKIARPAPVGAPKREWVDRAGDKVVVAAGDQAAQAKERLESEAPVLIAARAAADVEEIDFVRAPDSLEEILVAKFQDAHGFFLELLSKVDKGRAERQKAIAKGTRGQQCPGMRKLMQSLARRLLPSAHLEITLPTGIHVPIGSRAQISRFEEIFLARTYDDLLDRIPLPATLCDLGCNAGYFPLALEHRKRLQKSAVATRYLCIDANPDCVKIARRSLSRNLPADAWRVVQGCVGEPGEEMRFHLSKADAHSSVFAKYSHVRTVKMKALDLTSLFRETFPDGIDLLKVDIEGAEKFLVMSWGEALRCRRIMVEYHPFCGLTAAEFAARLKQLGFEAELFHPELNSEQLGLFARRE